MTDRPAEETSAEAARVAQSMLSLFAKLYDPRLETLPPMNDGDGVDLLALSDAVEIIADTDLLTGPVKLEVLERLAKRPDRPPETEKLALSLVREDAPSREKWAQQLLSRLERDRDPRRDPLNRVPSDLVSDHELPGEVLADEELDVQQLFFVLQEDVRTLSLAIGIPVCHADRVQIGNRVALSIATEGWSTRPIGDFQDLANPTKWPKCPLQGTFFRRMDPVRDLAHDPGSVVPPDAGYSDVLREVVDFSLGWGFAEMTTDLDVVFFHDADRVGCTYDWRRSQDHRISVDQGFILVEDVPALGRRRITTLKQVRFVIGNLPPKIVCPIWGPVTALLAWACLPKP